MIGKNIKNKTYNIILKSENQIQKEKSCLNILGQSKHINQELTNDKCYNLKPVDSVIQK